MNIGLSAAAFPPNMTIPQCLRLAKRAAFDCVELEISEAGYLTLESQDRAVSFLRHAVENISLYVGCVRADVMPGSPVSEYARTLEQCIEICSGLGSNRLVVPLGGNADAQTAMTSLADALRGVSEIAAEFGVTVAIECGCSQSLTSAEMMNAYLDDIDRGWVGACLDTGYPRACDVPQEWIRTIGKRLRMVRCRDCRRLPGGELEYVSLLEGEIDWKQVRKALVDVGYDAAVIANAPIYRQYPELGIKHCGDKMKRVFGSATSRVE